MNLSRARVVPAEATTDESLLRNNTRVYKSWPLWAKAGVPTIAVLLLAVSIPKDGSTVATASKATSAASEVALRCPAAPHSQIVGFRQVADGHRAGRPKLV